MNALGYSVICLGIVLILGIASNFGLWPVLLLGSSLAIILTLLFWADPP